MAKEINQDADTHYTLCVGCIYMRQLEDDWSKRSSNLGSKLSLQSVLPHQ